MIAVEVENVTFHYPDGSLGVRNINLKIKDGERVALVGANGSGKSTLLLLIAGLLKPNVGRVKIYGKDIEKWNRSELRKTVGIVFQNPDDFLFNPTVRDELLYTPAQLDLPMNEALKLIEEYSELFDLKNILDKPPFRLSGGEKKKVALACVMMLKPKIILLDEPTANVDGKTRRNIINYINNFDGTVIIATHELDMIPKLADRVVLLDMNKTIVADGDLSLLEDTELLEKACIL